MALIYESNIILLIFILISIFSFGGAFTNVSYVDILGKSIKKDSRKSFLSIRQVISGIILFLSALAAKEVLTLSVYPSNYAYMFFIAFGALFIASFGFWNIKEVTPSQMTVKNPKHFFKLIKTELKQNDQLKYFLGFLNTMGISIALLPFVMLYAKEFYFSQADTGSFLLYKIIGSAITGFALFFFAGKYKYRYLLYGSAILAFILPLFILLSSETPQFVIIFFIGGIIFTAFAISKSGIMLEISGTKNRTIYGGIAGIGNILPAVFALSGGWIIKQFGFQPFFIIFMLIVLSSLFFIYKIKCKK